ncbi:MAG: 5-formyltetrahydrofolate cyclo-ligase [Thermoplasmatales archaeon]|nr:MAG: 5-formyltetrahydrofolate cyclo-ligase [Thermoplasmatales archaeon]
MKDNLRTAITKKRNNISKSELIEKNNKIKKNIFEMEDYRKAKTILFYVSYGSEVNTHDIIKECISNEKKIVVPKTGTIGRRLVLSELTSWDDLEYGTYNILEPKRECLKEVSIESIDLMFIPGVVFDTYGNRIGHGMGYYDRLLKNSYAAPRVGLAFELQIVDEIQTEAHDVKVNKIVTEERIITCTNAM